MYQFFKMIKQVADSDPTEYGSIAELTNKILVEAGYHKELQTLKNGKTRLRNSYNKPFDSILTAKWFMYYKKLFMGKLASHPEFKESRIDIMTRTFETITKWGNPDKFINDSIVNRYVNMSLANRIGEVLYNMGSDARLQMLKDTTQFKKESGITSWRGVADHFNNWRYNRPMRANSALNSMASSLNQLAEDINFQIEEPTTVDSIIDSADMSVLKDELKDNRIGLKFLEACLNSNKRIVFSKICDFIKLNESEMTESAKEDLLDAYKIIGNYLINSLVENNQDVSKYKLKNKLNIDFKESSKDLELSNCQTV